MVDVIIPTWAEVISYAVLVVIGYALLIGACALVKD